MYAAGRGVQRDEAAAAKWHREAAESSTHWGQSEVIVVGFTPYEDEDEWDAYIVSRQLREMENRRA